MIWDILARFVLSGLQHVGNVCSFSWSNYDGVGNDMHVLVQIYQLPLTFCYILAKNLISFAFPKLIFCMALHGQGLVFDKKKSKCL